MHQKLCASHNNHIYIHIKDLLSIYEAMLRDNYNILLDEIVLQKGWFLLYKRHSTI